MKTNIQISLDEKLWLDTVRVGKPLGLEPAQIIQQALLGWLSQHDGQRFEQEWIAALQQNPDEAGRAEDWLATKLGQPDETRRHLGG